MWTLSAPPAADLFGTVYCNARGCLGAHLQPSSSLSTSCPLCPKHGNLKLDELDPSAVPATLQARQENALDPALSITPDVINQTFAGGASLCKMYLRYIKGYIA